MAKGQSRNDTHALVSELVEVLRDELAAHHKIIQLELAKREAIIARDGEKLKCSATEQAEELHRIDLLESRREKIAARISPGNAKPSLSELIESEAVPAPEKKELGRYQLALRAALVELRKLSEVNTKMLADSRDLFKSMLMSLAGKRDESIEFKMRPVLVDANC